MLSIPSLKERFCECSCTCSSVGLPSLVLVAICVVTHSLYDQATPGETFPNPGSFHFKCHNALILRYNFTLFPRLHDLVARGIEAEVNRWIGMVLLGLTLIRSTDQPLSVNEMPLITLQTFTVQCESSLAHWILFCLTTIAHLAVESRLMFMAVRRFVQFISARARVLRYSTQLCGVAEIFEV